MQTTRRVTVITALAEASEDRRVIDVEGILPPIESVVHLGLVQSLHVGMERGVHPLSRLKSGVWA